MEQRTIQSFQRGRSKSVVNNHSPAIHHINYTTNIGCITLAAHKQKGNIMIKTLKSFDISQKVLALIAVWNVMAIVVLVIDFAVS